MHREDIPDESSRNSPDGLKRSGLFKIWNVWRELGLKRKSGPFPLRTKISKLSEAESSEKGERSGVPSRGGDGGRVFRRAPLAAHRPARRGTVLHLPRRLRRARPGRRRTFLRRCRQPRPVAFRPGLSAPPLAPHKKPRDPFTGLAVFCFPPHFQRLRALSPFPYIAEPIQSAFHPLNENQKVSLHEHHHDH